jgi:hypothetical protein
MLLLLLKVPPPPHPPSSRLLVTRRAGQAPRREKAVSQGCLVSPEGLQDALKEPSARVLAEGGGGEEGEQGGGADQEVEVDSKP